MRNCLICNSTTSFLFTAKDQNLVKCGKCGFVHVEKQPTSEELDAIYGTAYFSHNKYRDLETLKYEEQRRLHLLEKYLMPGKNLSVLDAGCANGDFIAVAKDFYDMHGTDYSAHAIENAKVLNPEIAQNLTSGLLEEQRYSAGQFDAIVLWDVIEHIWDPKEIANKLFSFLKEGGYLFISTPNIEAPFARLTGKYWPFMTPPEHLSFFSHRSFSELFEKQLTGKIAEWKSRGKRANVGFIFYKAKRIFPRLVPRFLINLFEKKPLGKLALYVPTGDVQYLVVQKPVKVYN